MKKYKVTVTIEKEYEVSVDPERFNEEWKQDFERYFHNLEDEDFHQSIAKDVTNFQARFGEEDGHIEGYGYVTRNGKLPIIFGEDKREATPGLDITLVDDHGFEDIDIQEVPS